MALERVGQQVAAIIRRSQERRHRIADDRDLERLLALDAHFAQDLGISELLVLGDIVDQSAKRSHVRYP